MLARSVEVRSRGSRRSGGGRRRRWSGGSNASVASRRRRASRRGGRGLAYDTGRLGLGACETARGGCSVTTERTAIAFPECDGAGEGILLAGREGGHRTRRVDAGVLRDLAAVGVIRAKLEPLADVPARVLRLLEEGAGRV